MDTIVQRALEQKLHNKVAKMSMIELNQEIDRRIDLITSGTLEGEELEAEKAQAVELGKMALRRRGRSL
jgi:hypothetical protein